MSEEILKALTQLFAIITKQDDGVSDIERQFVVKFFQQRLSKDAVDEYLSLYESFLVDKRKDKDDGEGEEKKSRLTSMKDSVRTLSICKKINKTLTQKQKVIVLIELLELVNSDKNFSPLRKEIINTVSEVFNIPTEEYELVESFILKEEISELDYSQIIVAANKSPELEKSLYLHSQNLDGYLLFVKIESVDLYFCKYLGSDEMTLNTQTTSNNRVYLFSHGSTIKPSKGAPFYYSDIVSHFNKDEKQNEISFNCVDVEFTFPNGTVGLRGINIAEDRGKLIGIMGASGAGKTTLMNVLAGIESPSKGQVLINGIDIHKDSDRIKGIIGYISQDDILIEDLTVFENLYYNAKLCFHGKSEEDIVSTVNDVLSSLGLDHIKHLKVGNVLNKKISGGQRKRLNIALELIREPAVMFVDEPTSGLSSRDSENVIDLLKELSLKGKLIFVVIHQPSSDIYKKFDKMFIMDTGGYPVFNGNPVEGIIYFKKATDQINSDKGQCSECGSVNPEQLFDIIEARVVNEYGKLTNKRKVTPQHWGKLYLENFDIKHDITNKEAPPTSLKIPSRFGQWIIYTLRDLKSKISNKQYLVINLLEAPVLALLLAVIIRYTNNPDGTGYLYRYNENIPAYILMSIIVALFMGLTVSAEEIIRDRKISKREKFLNLSRTSYLLSKIGILVMLSAIQTLMFVLIGNTILEIHGMYLNYWLILFATSCFANILGLNISATFNEAVTVYIIIPLLLIPQMVMSGALFKFEKLNSIISTKDTVPLLADIMTSRWAYEALAVEQYKSNSYEEYFFDIELMMSNQNFIQAYLIPEIENLINKNNDLLVLPTEENMALIDYNSLVILNTLNELSKNVKQIQLPVKIDEKLNYTEEIGKSIRSYLSEVNQIAVKRFEVLNKKNDDLTAALDKALRKQNSSTTELKDKYYNESLEDLVRNTTSKERIEIYNGKIIQKIDPIYIIPTAKNNFDYRSQFYSPIKKFFGNEFETFYFNFCIIWLQFIILYLTLYFEVFKKLLDLLGNIKLSKSSEEH